MNIHKKEDAFLWNKLKGGCTTALGNLYDLYIEELFSYGIKIHQNREFVKDCIHDLFLDLYKYHSNLAKTDNVKYYLLLSLKRKIIKNIQLNKTHLPEIDILNTRLTEEAAIAFLGKAQVFQGKNAEAATTLKKIINPGKYSLYADYENVLRAVADFNNESIFEFNSINDPDNALNQGNTILGTMLGYRSDKLNLTGYYSGVQPIYPAGWGFASPRVGLYNAFVQMEGTNGYRLNNTIKTYKDLMAMTITLNPGTGLYGNEGYFNWKQRYIGSEVIPTSFGFTITANYRVMRYAEVLLLAAEASIQSNDPASALIYVNMVRERAHLTKLGSVTLDDIKKEKRLELCFEGVRFQDLVRWGDAKSALENQGKNVPVFFGVKGDGSFDVQYPYTNTVFGFITGKHELLPFPEHEMNVNKQIEQNNNW